MTTPVQIHGVLRFLNASKSKAAAAIPDKMTSTIDPACLSRQETVLNIDAAAEDFDRCLRAAKGMATEATMGKPDHRPPRRRQPTLARRTRRRCPGLLHRRRAAGLRGLPRRHRHLVPLNPRKHTPNSPQEAP